MDDTLKELQHDQEDRAILILSLAIISKEQLAKSVLDTLVRAAY